LNIFLHGEQMAFLTELSLILGDFGLTVAKAAEEVTNNGKKPPVKAIEEPRNRSNTSEKLLDPTRSQSTVMALCLNFKAQSVPLNRFLFLLSRP